MQKHKNFKEVNFFEFLNSALYAVIAVTLQNDV